MSGIQLDAVVNAPGTLTYSPATGTVLAAGTQTLTVTFVPANPNMYTTVTASVTLMVNQVAPVVTWAAPLPITYGTALGSAQLDASANVPGTFTYSPSAGTVLNAGTQTLTTTFTPSDTTDYSTATASITLTVNKATPVIVWAPPTAISYGTALSGTQLDATATVQGTFVYSPAAGTVPPAGNQTLSVTFTPTDSADYATATASVVLTVNQAYNANGYIYGRAISIDHTKVPNTDQVNFPLLISMTDPLLATTANGGHVANPNGYDIIFTSDPAGQNPLNYEMEEYNPATGQMIAWVQIPDVSHTTDTVIYLFYGNPNISASQAHPAATWDSNYKAVWHLDEGKSATAFDSTANANTGSWTGNGASYYAAGKLAPYAGDFDGSTDRVIVPNAPPLDISGTGSSVTLSAWIYLGTSTSGFIIRKGYEAGNASEWGLGVTSIGSNTYAVFRTVAALGRSQYASSAPLSLNTWHYVVASASYGATNPAIYVDGVAQSLTSSDSSAGTYNFPSTSNPVNLGASSNGTNYFHGFIEDARISAAVRSSDWIATEYNNQSSPSTFYAVSDENLGIAPPAVTLYAQQSQQFTTTAIASCPRPRLSGP